MSSIFGRLTATRHKFLQLYPKTHMYKKVSASRCSPPPSLITISHIRTVLLTSYQYVDHHSIHSLFSQKCITNESLHNLFVSSFGECYIHVVAVSFIFNWIGLLASQCLSQSVAGRLGSMAGFGLSLVKWVAILKVNTKH